MLNEPTNSELARQIQELKSFIKEGFDGVHNRQDKTNGNVIKNTEFRIKATANIEMAKYLIGVLGISNIGIIVKIVFLS